MKKIKRILLMSPLLGLGFCHPVNAGDWTTKPVMCGSLEETVDAMQSRNEVLLFSAKQFTKVKDPDEGDGLSSTPAILPFGLYFNPDTKTYTALEWHGHPYNQYCILSFGIEGQIGEIE